MQGNSGRIYPVTRTILVSEEDISNFLPSTPSPSQESIPPESPKSSEQGLLRESSNPNCHEPRTSSSSIPVSVQSYLVENMPTRGDGLCIIRAVHANLRYSTEWGLTLDDLSRALLNEVETNKDKYSMCCPDTKDIVEAFKEYIKKRCTRQKLLT